MVDMLATHMHHNPLLVVLSYIIATLSAYASIDLARRVKTSTKKKVKLIWLCAGATALGIGIWSMHFIAMLAYHFPAPVYYDTFLVSISVLIAIIGCVLGFYIVSSKSFTLSRFLCSGIIMGLGIASMHYIGMEAVKPVVISYNKLLVALSILIAILTSMVALWIGFFSSYSQKEMSWKLKLVFSLFMAGAITGMHYTGMVATLITMDTTLDRFLISSMMDTNLLAWIVIVVTIFIFFIFFFSISFDRMWRKYETVQSTILDSAVDGIVVTNIDGQIVHANPAFYKLMRREGANKAFPSLQEYLPNLSEIAFNQEHRLENNSYILEVKRHPIVGDSQNDSLWFIRDITDKIHAEKRIEFLAYHDPLTHLPNRHKLDDELMKLMATEQHIACIYLDLDKLKFTNDTLGHQAGDTLLNYVAKRLLRVIEERDFLARIGGDEFIIILKQERVKDVYTIAKQCINEMNIPFTINGSNLRVTISAGVSIYPKDAATASELIRFADLALYESKRNGKNQVTLFHSEIKKKFKRTVQLEKLLIKAINNHELYLLYQPKICVKTGEVEGVESLLRWKHPVLGQISPVEFIPIAEEKDMIYDIGEWVLKESCFQWVKWNDEHKKPIKISVNISPLQFSKEDFLPKLESIIQMTKMDPNYLELEITESASLAFEEQTSEKLTKIKQMGIKISLDDFGTGYSSFNHLKELPIEVLKIDKSFVDQLVGNKGQESIVRSMIQLGHNLNMKVLVEGVENKLQVDWLKKEGCDLIQGFYYSKPVLPNEIIEMVDSLDDNDKLSENIYKY